MLHADQHPGNYLFQEDGSIGLVDFGCVKRFSFDILEKRKWYEKRIWRESEATARRVDEEIEKILSAAYDTARDLLDRNRTSVKALADALLDQESLEADELKTLLDQTGAAR